MKRNLKNKVLRNIAAILMVLYAFVFIGSSYLHHHHEKVSHINSSISEDNSCDLCDASPAKFFNAEQVLVIEFLNLPTSHNSTYIQKQEQNCEILLNNKAPPALA